MNNKRKEFENKIKHEYLKDVKITRCEKCNKSKSVGSLEIHHKIELSLGGTNDYDNLIVLCKRCHDEWHNVEGIDGITFDKWMNIPPYFVLVYNMLSIERNIDSAEKEDILKINKDNLNTFLSLAFEVYKNQQE